MADFHYPFSDTAQEKQNKAYKAIASPESQQNKNIHALRLYLHEEKF